MAIQQTQIWRKREAINKKIERQIEQGLTPLTIYKTFFPFTEGGDIIDRRTGKVKTAQQYIDEATRAQYGTQKQFVARQMRKGVSRSAATRAYSSHRAQIGKTASQTYGTLVNILAGMDITETAAAKRYQQQRMDEIVPSFLSSMAATYGSDSPEYRKAVEFFESASDAAVLEIIRQASKKSAAPRGGTRTVSFYKMIAEIAGLDEPDPPTP